MIDKLKSNPVRVYLYSIIVLLAGYLLAKGVVAADDATFIIALAGAILGVEAARSQVTPVSKYEPKHKA